MEFDDILRISIFILIPILGKVFGDKKKIAKSNQKRNINNKKTFNDRESPARDNERMVEKPELRKEIFEPKYAGNSSDSFIEVEYKEEKTSYKQEQKKIKREKKKVSSFGIRDVIIKNEIGHNNFDLDFSKEDLVKGVIMSEILSKPKSLQRH